jgi:hypothetical protein
MFRLLKTILLSLLMLTFVACNRDDDPTDSAQLRGTLTCEVDGQPWEADFLAQAQYSDDGSRQVLTIIGQRSSDNSQVQLILNPFSGAGTYQIVKGDFSETDQGRYTGENPVADTYTTLSGAGSGSIEVAEFATDGQAVGTFSFTALNANRGNAKVEVTNGSFDLAVDSQ